MKIFFQKSILFLLIPLFILSFVELIARYNNIPKISHHNIYAKSQSLIPLVGRNSLIILGDSRMEWGIKPINLEREFNKNNRNKLNAINLAMPGSNGIDILLYLKARKIYPKVLVLGYSPNVVRYKNHNLNIIKYTFFNMVIENIKYYIKQTLLVSDKSIFHYLKNGKPYFKSHKYDKSGGVIVFEYGDYSQRKQHQVKMYQKWREDFDITELREHITQLNKLITHFKKGGSLVFGLYMPVSDDIYNIERLDGMAKMIKHDKFFDYSNLYTNCHEEKERFYEGSHLSHEYSYKFSVMFGNTLKNEVMFSGR